MMHLKIYETNLSGKYRVSDKVQYSVMASKNFKSGVVENFICRTYCKL